MHLVQLAIVMFAAYMFFYVMVGKWAVIISLLIAYGWLKNS